VTDLVPKWAGLFPKAKFPQFVELVKTLLAARGLTYTGNDRVDLSTAGDYMVLHNITAKCAQKPERKWTRLINDFLDRNLASFASFENLKAREVNFEKIRGDLRVRLIAAGGDIATDALQIVTRPYIVGVLQALAIDLPDDVSYVVREKARLWNLPDEELFTIALENVRQEPPLKPYKKVAPDGTEVTALDSDSPYAATHVLWLGDYIHGLSERGALVGLPYRNVIYVHALSSGSRLAAKDVWGLTLGDYRHEIGALSPHLYWWRGGQTFVPLTRVTRGVPEYDPPDDFLAAAS
jgi:hypothetical protein